MTPKQKAVLIGTVLGALPTFVALIPYTILWWYFVVRTGGPWLSFDIVTNLKWGPIFVVCWVVSWKGLNIVAGYIMRRGQNHEEYPP